MAIEFTLDEFNPTQRAEFELIKTKITNRRVGRQVKYRYYGKQIVLNSDTDHYEFAPVGGKICNDSWGSPAFCVISNFIRPITLEMVGNPEKLQLFLKENIVAAEGDNLPIIVEADSIEGWHYAAVPPKKREFKSLFRSINDLMDYEKHSDEYYDYDGHYYLTVGNYIITNRELSPFEDIIARIIDEIETSTTGAPTTREEVLALWQKKILEKTLKDKTALEQTIANLRADLLEYQSQIGRHNILICAMQNHAPFMEEQLIELEKIPGVRETKIVQTKFSFTTEEIYATIGKKQDCYIGIFEIVLDIRTNKCKLRNLAAPGNWTHPHQYEGNEATPGRLCLGGYSPLLGSCLEHFKYPQFVLTLLEFLRTVSPDDTMAVRHYDKHFKNKTTRNELSFVGIA